MSYDYNRPKVEGPQTVDEWVDFIANEIPSNKLIHQARVMGSAIFMRVLREEGFTAKDIEALHLAMVRRFLVEGVRIPQNMENCSINYFQLAEQVEFEKQLKEI